VRRNDVRRLRPELFACRGTFRIVHTSSPSASPGELLIISRTYSPYGNKSIAVMRLQQVRCNFTASRYENSRKASKGFPMSR